MMVIMLTAVSKGVGNKLVGRINLVLTGHI